MSQDMIVPKELCKILPYYIAKRYLNSEFKITDIKNGMWVETEDGTIFLALINSCYQRQDTSSFLVDTKEGRHIPLSSYGDTLCCRGVRELNIVKVYAPTKAMDLYKFDPSSCKLVYERRAYD
jgi:hypothetical protein